jgi:hypothetical protein
MDCRKQTVDLEERITLASIVDLFELTIWLEVAPCLLNKDVKVRIF